MNDLSAGLPAKFARVDAPALKSWLKDGQEIALLDVREHGQYGESHLFFAVPLPYSRLEIHIARLVPRRATRVVVYDGGNGDAVAERAAHRLAETGYSNVFVLEGGTEAWTAAGYQLFAGVNVPSKTFGELAESVFHTPRISAQELARRLADGDDLVVLDGRPVEEYRRMSIPTATCCPNGELALRAPSIVPSRDTTIVVNCAGRTRSIIGAQNLIDMNVGNPVLALENGTQGWYLADLALEKDADRLYPPSPPAESLPALQERARTLAEEWHVPFVGAEDVERLLLDPASTTYLCDVRTPEEFAAGSLPGAQSTPGGQLIQATDQYVGTRMARVVVFDGECVRAPVIAARLRQMGWNAMVLEEGVSAKLPDVADVEIPLPALPTVDTKALAALGGEATLIDLRPSGDYRALHLKGAVWAIRPQLDLHLATSKIAILVVDDRRVAQLAAKDLTALGVGDIRVHLADPAAWAAAGLETETSSGRPTDEESIDFLFFVHDRHSGNKAAARRYLEWETNLLAQIDDDERNSFGI